MRFNTARRNSILAKARADYQNTNNNHREAVQYERLIAAAEKMPQAERKAIVDSNSDVLKGRQQAIVHAKEAALWAGVAEALRLYIMARSRIGQAVTAAGAAGGGMRHDGHGAPPASWRSATAHTVLGSCISARIPRMRAPPEAETETTLVPSAAARSHARAKLLSDDAAHRAAQEREVHHRAAGTAASRSTPAPVTIASPRPVAISASARRSV